MSARRPAIIAHHLLWTLYGHWVPNDLRGSGSREVASEKLAPLGPVHFGRKPDDEQPSRKELREFYTKAAPLLDHSVFWIDSAKRQAIGDAIGRVVVERNYTVWACAILSNHVHMVVRRHRDDALAIWHAVAEATGATLRVDGGIAADHPVWAGRPYKVFLRTADEVRGRVTYVERNPEKEGLSRQHYEFVRMYDDWPFHKVS